MVYTLPGIRLPPTVPAVYNSSSSSRSSSSSSVHAADHYRKTTTTNTLSLLRKNSFSPRNLSLFLCISCFFYNLIRHLPSSHHSLMIKLFIIPLIWQSKLKGENLWSSTTEYYLLLSKLVAHYCPLATLREPFGWIISHVNASFSFHRGNHILLAVLTLTVIAINFSWKARSS